MQQPSRRQAIATGLAGLGTLTWGAAHAASEAVVEPRHHDHIIGTSLDLWFQTSDTTAADAAETAVLAEIERLRTIFSTYDPHSELSRLNRQRSMHVALDMLTVLRAYETWHARSNLCSAQLEAFVQVWRMGQQMQTEPSPRVLAELLHQMAPTPWTIDGQTVTRLTDLPLNLNAIAKGYIIQEAARVARTHGMASGVLNLGGDLCIWGEPSIVAVQNPHDAAENARPLTLLRVDNQAVATSGGYQRFYTIHDHPYSHLLDPRTGRPATALASVTVIAPTNVVANALATTAAVGTVAEALRLVEQTPGCECLLVQADGQQVRSTGFAAYELESTGDSPDDSPKKDEPKKDAKAEAWPADFQVHIALELLQPSGGRAKRPYVAVWLEDAAGKPVRTVTVWGNSPRWIRDLSVWWKFAKDDAALVKAVSRATRAPGKYEVVWDGKDDKGNPVPQGTYTVKIEVHREHGKHLTQSGNIKCGTEPAKLTLEKTAEAGDAIVEYRKKK